LNQSEPNVILTAHATKVNRPEPNWTEPQTCLAGRNHALSCSDSAMLASKEHHCVHYLPAHGVHDRENKDRNMLLRVRRHCSTWRCATGNDGKASADYTV